MIRFEQLRWTDAAGWREELGFGMARPVELVDFQAPLPLPN